MTGQCADAIHEFASRRATSALTHDIAHPVQFVEARLQGRERRFTGGDLPAFDQLHERFEFMTQIAHGANARHARTALQRVDDALQFKYERVVPAILLPCGQRLLRSLQQLRCFFGKDSRDFGIEIRIVCELLLDSGRRRDVAGAAPQAGACGD